LKNFLQTLAIEKCTIVGHSFGGLLALKFALEYPGNVSALVLVDAAGTYQYAPAQEAFMRAAYTPEKIMASARDQIKMSMKYGLGQWQESYEALVDKWAALSKSSEYKNYTHAVHRAMITFLESNLTEQVPEVSAPTLILWGENDAILPLKAGEKLNHLIKDSRMYVFKGTGHFPMLTQSEKFNQEVAKFLKEIKK
jgi:pimeloyl-ACP methyl ester carboxylesterase